MAHVSLSACPERHVSFCDITQTQYWHTSSKTKLTNNTNQREKRYVNFIHFYILSNGIKQWAGLPNKTRQFYGTWRKTRINIEEQRFSASRPVTTRRHIESALVVKWFDVNPPCTGWSRSCRILSDSLDKPDPCDRKKTVFIKDLRQRSHTALFQCWHTCRRWRAYRVSGSSAESPVCAEIRYQRGVRGTPGTVVHLRNNHIGRYSVLTSAQIPVSIDRREQAHVKLDS